MTTFKGYRGHVMFLQVGNVKFFVLCKNQKQAQAIYSHIVPHAPPFNPEACTRAILIEATILPNERNQNPANASGAATKIETGDSPETPVGQ
jgi:hypothetical protein